MVHFMHLGTHLLLALLKTLLRFCIKMTPILLPHISLIGGSGGKKKTCHVTLTTVHEARNHGSERACLFPEVFLLFL